MLSASIFSAVVVALVGIFTAVIQWRQWKTAKTKVQLDLYNMRLPVYQATRDLLASITTDGFPGPADLWAYAKATEQAPFLFDDAFAAKLAAIYDRAAAASMDQKLLGAGTAQANKEAAARCVEHMAWLREQYVAVPIMFAPYLRLEGRAGRYA